VELIPLYVRISPEIHEWLQDISRNDRRSMASMTELLLRECMRRREPGALSTKYPADKVLEDINISEAVEKMISNV